ncbi:MAG TPA: hypothetical protein VF518_03265, partial [Polyangia bacterium]
MTTHKHGGRYGALAAMVAASACGANQTPTTGPAPAEGMAVINSDFVAASSLSLLDRNGQLMSEGCFNSGSRTPGLSQALSGDVVLPSQPQPGHEV